MQAHLLFKAHMLDGTTAPCLRMALSSLEDELTEDVQEHVGAVLARMVTERMAPQATASENAHMGPAKSVREAYEQARIVQLLEALDHPPAEIYGLARPDQMPQRFKAALRAQLQPREYSQGPAAMAQSQRAQATGPAHDQQAPGQSQQAQGLAWNQNPASSSQSQGAQATGQRQGAQVLSSQPEQLRKRGKKRPAAQQPSNHALPQARSANVPKSQQQQQQQQQSQGPIAANYGPEEQAEAKRQANKEAALAWMDKARAAALTKDWSAAVSCHSCHDICCPDGPLYVSSQQISKPVQIVVNACQARHCQRLSRLLSLSGHGTKAATADLGFACLNFLIPKWAMHEWHLCWPAQRQTKLQNRNDYKQKTARSEQGSDELQLTVSTDKSDYGYTGSAMSKGPVTGLDCCLGQGRTETACGKSSSPSASRGKQ